MSETQSPDEYEVEALELVIDAQPVELYKVLKIANMVSGGGEAKMLISEGYVQVNGEPELRKRCKIFDGDLIEFNGEYLYIVCDQPVTEATKVEKAKPKQKAKAAKQTDPAKQAKSNNAKNKGAKAQPKATKKPAVAKPVNRDQHTGRAEIKF